MTLIVEFNGTGFILDFSRFEKDIGKVQIFLESHKNLAQVPLFF